MILLLSSCVSLTCKVDSEFVLLFVVEGSPMELPRLLLLAPCSYWYRVVSVFFAPSAMSMRGLTSLRVCGFDIARRLVENGTETQAAL